jgi:hypothetical protein
LDVVFAALLNIVDDLDHPVIVDVPDGGVAVTWYFVVKFRHGSGDDVGVQVACGRSMLEVDDISRSG